MHNKNQEQIKAMIFITERKKDKSEELKNKIILNLTYSNNQIIIFD